MRQYFRILIFVVLMSVVNSAFSSDSFLTKFYNKYKGSVVAIQVYDPISGIFQPDGTGFVYDHDTVITAKHCVDDTTLTYRVIINGKAFTIKKIWLAESTNDTAALDVNEEIRQVPLKLSKSDPVIGARCLIIGNPLEFTSVISDGFINQDLSQMMILGNFGLLGFSTPIAPGNSGGPLLDSEGRVLGIVLGACPPYSNLNFATGVEQIKRALSTFWK